MAPLLALAILSAASMGANYAGQKKVEKGRTAALGEAREQRARNAKRAAETAQSTTDILTGTAAKEKAAAEALVAKNLESRAAADPLTGQTSEQLMSSVLAPTGSTRVIEDRDARRVKTNRFLDQQAGARSKLDAFGDVMIGNNIGVQRNAQDIGQIAANLQNWNQNVLPAQLNSANMAGRNWNTLADALQLAAMVYAPIGLTKGAAVKAGTTAASAGVGAGAAGGDAAIRAANAQRLLNAGYGSAITGVGVSPYM